MSPARHHRACRSHGPSDFNFSMVGDTMTFVSRTIQGELSLLCSVTLEKQESD